MDEIKNKVNIRRSILREDGMLHIEFLNGNSYLYSLQEIADMLAENTTATLIASGYDWDCPKCDNQNHTIEIPSDRTVICPVCKKRFKISDIYSAYE